MHPANVKRSKQPGTVSASTVGKPSTARRISNRAAGLGLSGMTNHAVIPDHLGTISKLTTSTSNHHHHHHHHNPTPILQAQQQHHHTQATWLPYRPLSISSKIFIAILLPMTCILAIRKIPCVGLLHRTCIKISLHRGSEQRLPVGTVGDAKSVSIARARTNQMLTIHRYVVLVSTLPRTDGVQTANAFSRNVSLHRSPHRRKPSCQHTRPIRI